MVKYHRQGERSVVIVLVKAREPVVNYKLEVRVGSIICVLVNCIFSKGKELLQIIFCGHCSCLVHRPAQDRVAIAIAISMRSLLIVFVKVCQCSTNSCQGKDLSQLISTLP
jgi:hypothetical protein